MQSNKFIMEQRRSIEISITSNYAHQCIMLICLDGRKVFGENKDLYWGNYR